MKKITLLINRIDISKRQIDTFGALLSKSEYDFSIDFYTDSYHEKSKLVSVLKNELVDSSDNIYFVTLPGNLAERNKKMVDDSDEVIGFPDLMNDKEDSSFWKTIRYAKAKGKKVTIISQIGNVWELKG
jgi:hypothetical protein